MVVRGISARLRDRFVVVSMKGREIDNEEDETILAAVI